MVQREGGTHTANAEQVHTLVEQAWMPIFKMRELGTRPTWEQFESSFGEHVPAAWEWIVNELQCEKVKMRVRGQTVGEWRTFKHFRCSCLRNWQRC